MKKGILTTILSIFLLLCAFFTPQIRTAQALSPSSGEYACVLEENAFFYSAPDEQRGLFLLPPTYYVRVLDYGVEFCRVEYLYDDTDTKRLVGYAKTADLTFVEYIPKRPYFYYVFEISYRIENGGLQDSAFLNEITLNCTYYGDYLIGSKPYCYVLRGGSFGYVPKPITLSVTPNTEYEEWLAAQIPPESEGPSEQSTDKEKSSPAQIAILVALCLLVPVLAALILKPPRRPPYETDG
jgi:hypothetical protein